MKNKVLLLLNNLPHETTAGGILYNQIIQSYGFENIFIFAFSSTVENTDSKINHFSSLFSLDFPRNNFFLKVLHKIPFVLDFYILLKMVFLKKKIFNAIEKLKPDIIFCQLRSNPLFVINDIIKNFDIPVNGMIEDTVEREKDSSFISYYIKKKSYYKAIPKMFKIGVAGETLKKYIEDKFDIDAYVIRPWYKKSSIEKELNNNINIFFGGNLYAKIEFYQFIKALDIYSEKHKNFNINFIVATKNKINFVPKFFKIKELGWVTEQILNLHVEKCHVSYLPYVFDPKLEHSMTYAFPGKAGYYISNNLPILFHGPKYSSFNSFLKLNRVGVSCSSLDLDKIVESISKFISKKDTYTIYQNSIEKAYYSEYSKSKFDSQINKLFNLQ
jgi:hypothetical protein